jgi:hypothetical protein
VKIQLFVLYDNSRKLIHLRDAGSRDEVGYPVNIKFIQPVLESKKLENNPILPGQIYIIV